MSEVFDPYYLWLGIPPADQPPDHYRLLGIAQFESNADVIRNAAEQRMSYLRTVTGPRAKRAQQLVNEIVTAQRILAEDASREKYNAMITENPLAKRRGVSPPAISTPGFEPPSINTLDAGSHRRRGGRGGGGKTKSKTQRPQIKIIAAVVPAVLGLIALTVIIVLLSSGGRRGKTPSERQSRTSQSDAGKGVPKSTEAEKKKADRDLEKQLARLEKQRPKPPKPTEPKPDKPEAPKPSKKIAASQGESLPKDRKRGAGFNGARASELSETEKAEALLASRGLDEGFNSEWELAELTAAYEEAINLSGSSSKVGDAIFEAELKRRVEAKKREILDRWAWLNSQGPDNGGPNDQEYNRIAGWIRNTNDGLSVRDTARPIVEIRTELELEYANRSSTPNAAVIEMASQLRAQYAALRADAAVQAALKTVGGTLAEPPEIPDKVNRDQPKTTPLPNGVSKASQPPENAPTVTDSSGAVRITEELRNNPEKLLESMGFEKKQGEWVFAKEQKLKLATKQLIGSWKQWQKARPQNDAQIKTKLEAYNKLLLESFENSAMRLAVREDLMAAMVDPDVAAALVKLNVKTTELNKSAKALQKPDSKLKKAIPKKPPVIPSEKAGHFYAALIIAEKESAIVHLDPETMGQRDSPNLFIIPRAKWDAAGGKMGEPKNVMFNDGWGGTVLETSGLPIRCGSKRASNPTVHLPLKPAEGGLATDIHFLGGRAGSNGWKKFFSQMKEYKIEPSVGAIKQARQKLDAYQPDYKKKK